MKVEIDGNSGFCPGVIRVVQKAEELLESGPLTSLGAIVHNEEELSRLRSKGLVSVDSLEDCGLARGSRILVRAHGVPPAFYGQAAAMGLEVTDCTCPVVLRLQKRIKEAYERVTPQDGKVIIFGKIGHAEVQGLVGQTGGEAKVVENIPQLLLYLACTRIKGPVEVFSQTTMDPEAYTRLCAVIKSHTSRAVVHETICAQVSSRHHRLSEFAAAHDIIVFVSGSTSSNGKVLYELCRSVNIRTYHTCSPELVQAEWFRPEDRVGVCGATSTPKWLLEAVAKAIENLQ